jgi:hypothetical protein
MGNKAFYSLGLGFLLCAAFVVLTAATPVYFYAPGLLPLGSSTAPGTVQVDGTTITSSNGTISAVGSALSISTTTQLGVVELDGTTITGTTNGVISASGAFPGNISGSNETLTGTLSVGGNLTTTGNITSSAGNLVSSTGTVVLSPSVTTSTGTGGIGLMTFTPVFTGTGVRGLFFSGAAVSGTYSYTWPSALSGTNLGIVSSTGTVSTTTNALSVSVSSTNSWNGFVWAK